MGAQGAASVETPQVQQSPGELRERPGRKAELSCRIPEHHQEVHWYKEEPGGGLLLIYRQSNSSFPKGKYSGRMENSWNFSLTIGPVQREDSGVYYCSYPAAPRLSLQFGDGTRLIVTDATEPKLSILLPVDSEEPGQPPADIPVLCHLHDVPPGWDTVKWQPGGEVTPVTAATVDDQGVLSAWSIAWVPAERWDGTAACTAAENSTGRSLSVAVGSTAVRN
ncbi:M1-specific T cell receptor beta chain-like [Dryobates pubescens]|uniref:M1-specific T cell receptor beta chain-like n=1 Tax=Dryobates pubescens TaxID=118200 RepID=UPI0023BA02A8|nr:M1-specific T cell receptor beta chain-like [Dryobates pubescens]